MTAVVAWSASARIAREGSLVATQGIPRCNTCGRDFDGGNLAHGLNQLKMHMRSHQEKTVVCPICRNPSKKFRTGADAVLHLESGYCPGCRGEDKAKSAIYSFVQKNAPGLMSQHLMIENGSGVPDKAYTCQMCSKPFTNLSALMQHQAAKHGGGSTAEFRMMQY